MTDWKQYVQSETDKAKKDGRLEKEFDPQNPVPAIDRERFSIRRKKQEEQETDGQSGAAGAKNRAGGASRPAGDTGAQQGSSQGSPLSSPFVSVHDVWKAAERTTKSRKTAQKDDTGVQKQKLPGIERVQRPKNTSGGTRKTKQSQSREEILERLVNPTITLEEAAKIMGVCKATVRRYTARGILPHYRTPGNQRRFKLNDIIEFMEEQRR